jgi:hypothetical protein
MNIGNEVLSLCRGMRSTLEEDYLPKMVGDKFNAVEGVGALLYQPCIYLLSRTIRIFERDSGAKWAQVAHLVVNIALVALSSTLAGIGFAIKKIGSFLPHDRAPRTDEVFQRTDPGQIDELYDIIKGFSEIAREINLDYRMGSGTALGAARHHGIIPWDDDGDFVILESEKAKIEQAIKDGVFQRKGLEAQFYPGMENYQIRFTEEERKKRGGVPSAAIDLFLAERVTMKQEGAPVERICYSSEFISEHFPHDYFTIDEWNQTQDWDFGPVGPDGKITLKGIEQKAMEQYLKRSYGKDCMTCGLKTHQHAEISIFGYRFSALGLPIVTREKVEIRDHSPAFGRRWMDA